MKYLNNIKSYLSRKWVIVLIVGLVLFVLLGGWSWIKTVFKNMRISGNESPGVVATEIYSNFHGSTLGFQPGWFGTNENNVVKIINSLPDYSAYKRVVAEYSKSYGKDLREDLNVELGGKYEQLKYK